MYVELGLYEKVKKLSSHFDAFNYRYESIEFLSKLVDCFLKSKE